MAGMKRRDDDDDDDDDDEEEEELDLIVFQGPLSGNKVDLAANARLVQAGLVPAKRLLTDAIRRRADTIRIEPRGERASVSLLIDGVAYPGTKLPRTLANAVTQIMKLVAGLDPKLRARRQQGALKAEREGIPFELSVDATPLEEGERLIVRLRNLKAKLNTLEDLGFPPHVKAKLREMTGKRHGSVVVCGPAGSGVTTLLFALLRGIDLYMYSIVSVNQIGPGDVYNISVFDINEGDDLTKTCERIKRAEADGVYTDPLRDSEYIRQAFQAAEKLTMISEMQAKDAAHALAQICETVQNPELVASVLEGIYSPKLLRTLCSCKQAFRPNPKLLEKVGLPSDLKVLYRKFEYVESEDDDDEEPEICEKCDGLGYLGRAAMLEILEMTDGMKEVIKTNPTVDRIKEQMRRDKMQTFHRDGLRLVAEGKTSLEELQRVFKGG